VKDDGVYVRHVMEAIGRIRSYTSAARDAFEQDLKTPTRASRSFNDAIR
jgi:uncharacterized protein with HEPN domain